MIAPAVYILCALTSLACAALLLRGYLRSRSRLLLWSTLCFVGLTVQNALLFIDLAVISYIDFSIPRNAAGVIGLSLLLFGLVWEAE